MTSPEIAVSAEPAPEVEARRIRGLSPLDAIAVLFVAGIVGAFLEPRWPVGIVLLSAVALVYGAFRVTRGLPTRRRVLAMASVFLVHIVVAAVLQNLGY